MALVLKDRVKQAAAAPGTGTITLGATAAGFQSFASVGNGNTTYFAIVDSISGDWEVNYGVYTSSGTTLTRNATPLSSSTGTLVNFTGAVDVFVTYPSENAVWRDTAGVVVQQSFGAITATSAALTTGTITGAPVNATDIVNKEYADSIASGLNYHQPVNYGSTAALPTYVYNNGASGVGATITAVANGALSLGGGSPSATQRVLVKDEIGGNAPYNGIYTVTQAGTSLLPFILTRATDYDTSGTGTNEIDAGDYVLVISGTLASTAWVQQTPLPITVGTTAITFLQFNAPITYTAGTGLNLSPATTFNISNTGVTATTYGSASAVPVVTFNAQGQATGVTNTTIAIAGSQVSGNISGQAGSVANALTLGTYLTGGTYNGSAAVTATVDATSANTASKVVARDSSGNFSAGTITATLSGSSTSATTATNLAGGAANQIPYQTGSGATSFITAASGTNTVLNFNGSAFSWSAGTISGVPLGSNLNSLTAGTYLTGTAYNGSAAQTWTVNAASANTASTVVARDASGNFSASTITASLSGNATTATTATNQSGGTVSATTGAFTSDVVIGGGDLTVYRAGGATGVLYLNSAQNRYLYWNSATYELAGAELNINGNRALNAGNYNSYAPTLTGTGASGTWGINITGSAGSATTLANFTATTSSSGFNPDSPPTIDQIGYWYGGSSLYGYSDGGLYTSGYSTSWYHQISGDFRSGQIAVRGKNSGTWQSWYYIPTYSLNNGYSTGSLYAGIYYDANNTSYYVDPSSTSSFYSGFTFAVSNPTFSSPSYITMPGGAYFNSGTVYMEANLKARGGVGDDANAALTLTGGTGGYTNINGSARSPIFYDSDNTAYYGNFAGTSNFDRIAVVRSGDNVYTDANYGYGLVGAYSSYRYQGVFAMGDAYKLPPDGTTTGNLYGMAWSHPNAGGAASNLNSHGLLLLQNGGFMAALSTNGTFSADVRGTIFYDYNNTGYYIDPASTSDTALRMRGGALFGPNTTWGAYLAVGGNGWYGGGSYASVAATNGNLHMDAATGCDIYLNYYAGSLVRSYSSFYAPIFYDINNSSYYVDPASSSYLYSLSLSGSVYFQPNTWIQQNGSYGMYWPNTNGAHLEGNTLGGYGSIAIRGSRNSYGGIYDYFSGVNLGMYDSAGNGGVYREANGRWIFYHNISSNCTGFGTSTTNSAYNIYCPTGIYSGGRVDGTIFYDSNNTGYYLDMNGSSNMSTTVTGNLYFMSNFNTASGSSAPLQAYSSGGSGAVMSFHRGGYYAINFGLDSDNVMRLGGWSAPANLLQIDMSGNLTMLANVTAYSDERLKKDWDDLPSDFVPRLARVKSGTYTRIDNEMRQIGVGAQSLRPLMEEAVFENADGTLSVAYGNAAMASSVELARYVTALEQRISQLEARI